MPAVLFPYQAQGSLIEKDGKVIGSALIGQEFADDRYFHGRPSATNAPDPKDSDQDRRCALQRRQLRRAPTSGPTSKALAERVKGDVDSCKKENAVGAGAGGPGDDLRQRPRPATFRRRRRYFQVPRVAKARGLPEARVRALVEGQIEGRTFGLLGEPRVNVLEAQSRARRA